jgi:hypothetical protein
LIRSNSAQFGRDLAEDRPIKKCPDVPSLHRSLRKLMLSIIALLIPFDAAGFGVVIQKSCPKRFGMERGISSENSTAKIRPPLGGEGWGGGI